MTRKHRWPASQLTPNRYFAALRRDIVIGDIMRHKALPLSDAAIDELGLVTVNTPTVLLDQYPDMLETMAFSVEALQQQPDFHPGQGLVIWLKPEYLARPEIDPDTHTALGEDAQRLCDVLQERTRIPLVSYYLAARDPVLSTVTPIGLLLVTQRAFAPQMRGDIFRDLMSHPTPETTRFAAHCDGRNGARSRG